MDSNPASKNGSVVTTPEDSVNGLHNYWALRKVASAEEANEVSYAIANDATGEILTQGDAQTIQLGSEEAKEPIAQWKVVPQQDNAEVFYITNGQSGICLKDAQLGPETASIEIDAVPTAFIDHDSPLLWKFMAPKAAGNLTDIKHLDKKKFPAIKAMLFLINQWEYPTVPKDWKIGRKIADLSEKECRDNGFDLSVANRNVRLDLQTWNNGSKSYPRTGNVQGQVSNKSVLQVNIDPETQWGVRAIQDKLKASMNEVKEYWMPEKK
ncbi:hypothetical protein N7512_001289 [Penicillium capsulatum]|nr:hypothetical protein N7512_001289 [Penicillium capsulatum]